MIIYERYRLLCRCFEKLPDKKFDDIKANRKCVKAFCLHVEIEVKLVKSKRSSRSVSLISI